MRHSLSTIDADLHEVPLPVQTADSREALATARLLQTARGDRLDHHLVRIHDDMQNCSGAALANTADENYAVNLRIVYKLSPSLFWRHRSALPAAGVSKKGPQASEISWEFQKRAKSYCDLCERNLEWDETCGNPICTWSEESRSFRWVWGVSRRTGALQQALDLYKTDGVRGWAVIFARMLVDFLCANRGLFNRYDLIIPSPTYVGAGGRTFDHTGMIIALAAQESKRRWPFRLGVVEKTEPTPAFRGQPWQQRCAIATKELRNALAIAQPGLVRNKRVLVFDDVYTEGLTLREVARVLRQAGAKEVSEVVLARQPSTKYASRAVFRHD